MGHNYLSAFSQLTGQPNEADPISEPAGNSTGSDLEGDNVVPFVSKSSMSCLVPEKIQSDLIYEAGSGYLDDIVTLTAMELRNRYPREANSHKNMLARRKTKGAILHPDFAEFASFLRIMGPMPAKKATLDRVDNSDPEYAPGKVRWADKKTQNSNKSDTLIIQDAEAGQSYSVSQLAKLLNVLPDTIRKRKARGWTGAEIVSGVKKKPEQAQVPGKHSTKFPVGLYSPHQLALLMLPESSLTHCADISFHRDAHFQQASRDQDGEQYFLALYEELVAIDDTWKPHQEGVERMIAKWWKRMRPHIVFDMLTLAQQQLVAEIDPEYVVQKTSAAKTEP